MLEPLAYLLFTYVLPEIEIGKMTIFSNDTVLLAIRANVNVLGDKL